MSGIVVLGAGSPLMGDDGLGLVVLESLRARHRFEPDVELVDGGTWGMCLLPLIESTERLLILDAIHAGVAPGELVVLRDAELPRYLFTKVSPHQIDLRETLAVAELRGRSPLETVAVGLQPDSVEMRDGLSATLAARLDVVEDAVIGVLERWGVRTRPLEPAAR